MLTVCPRIPDIGSLLFGLLEKYPESISDELIQDLDGTIYRMALLKRERDRMTKEQSYLGKNLFSFFDQCKEPGMNNFSCFLPVLEGNE